MEILWSQRLCSRLVHDDYELHWCFWKLLPRLQQTTALASWSHLKTYSSFLLWTYLVSTSPRTAERPCEAKIYGLQISATAALLMSTDWLKVYIVFYSLAGQQQERIRALFSKISILLKRFQQYLPFAWSLFVLNLWGSFRFSKVWKVCRVQLLRLVKNM